VREFGWVAEAIQASPWVGLCVFVVYLTYRAVIKISQQPLSIATWVGVLGGKDRRKDAIEIVELLCDRLEEPPAIESSAVGTSRRRRRRRRRKR
jgi:hypothetical protein